MMRLLYPYLVLLLAGVMPLWAAGSVVKFDAAGIAQVDGKPFFPVGLFAYSLDNTVMAEIHEHKFNTVTSLTEHFKPDQLDFMRQHGLMAICPTTDEWVKAAKDHPALLAWYLSDEPEGHGQSPEMERERYLKLKALDPNHPIGLDHFLFESLAKYKDACDFTMTDVYPITAQRDVPITHVGLFTDEARRVHGPNWPHWAYIQVFGGPDTDGGKWAQPLPYEVRCMTYIALVHRVTGILYFSYWPKFPRTWDSLGPLNTEIYRMMPWLVTPGTELVTKSSDAHVQVRAKQVGLGGILIAVNTGPAFTRTDITLPSATAFGLDALFEKRSLTVAQHKVSDSFGPYETRVYTWGAEPVVGGR